MMTGDGAVNRKSRARNGNRVKTAWTLAGQTHSITSGIDWRGYVTGKSYSDSDGVGTVADPWRYDSAGRFKSMLGHITSIKYNARGQVTETVYANGVVTTNTFDASRGWLTRVVTAKTGVAAQIHSITPDVTGMNALFGQSPHLTCGLLHSPRTHSLAQAGA